MPTAVLRETTTALGYSFPAIDEVEADGGAIKEVLELAVAKTGTLTARTDNDTGELTMAASHGITTGARLDVYWDGGSRRGMTVGTVAGNVVPIDGGSGDNLPTTTTAITAQVPTSESIAFTGSNAVLLAYYSSGRGTIVLTTSGDVECDAHVMDGTVKSYIWTADRNATSPVAGETIAKVYFSNASSTTTAEQRVVVLYN